MPGDHQPRWAGRPVVEAADGIACGPVLVQLPVFASSTVVSVAGGSYNASARTVTVNAGATQAAITLTNTMTTPHPPNSLI